MLYCQLTKTLAINPVVCVGDGAIYDKSAILAHFQSTHISPRTGVTLDEKGTQLIECFPIYREDTTIKELQKECGLNDSPSSDDEYSSHNSFLGKGGQDAMSTEKIEIVKLRAVLQRTRRLADRSKEAFETSRVLLQTTRNELDYLVKLHVELKSQITKDKEQVTQDKHTIQSLREQLLAHEDTDPDPNGPPEPFRSKLLEFLQMVDPTRLDEVDELIATYETADEMIDALTDQYDDFSLKQNYEDTIKSLREQLTAKSTSMDLELSTLKEQMSKDKSGFDNLLTRCHDTIKSLQEQLAAKNTPSKESKKPRKCGLCGKEGHNKRKCPTNQE